MLKIHYFDNFKGAPTLLLAGARADIEGLVDLFGTWSGKDMDVGKFFDQQGIGIQVTGLSKLMLGRSLIDPSSIAKVVSGICEWRVSDSWKERIVGLLKGLAESESAAHQYLETEGTSVQILCSKDEYNSIQ